MSSPFANMTHNAIDWIFSQCLSEFFDNHFSSQSVSFVLMFGDRRVCGGFDFSLFKFLVWLQCIPVVWNGIQDSVFSDYDNRRLNYNKLKRSCLRGNQPSSRRSCHGLWLICSCWWAVEVKILSSDKKWGIANLSILIVHISSQWRFQSLFHVSAHCRDAM